METLTKADFNGEADYLGSNSRRVFVKGLGFVGVSLLLTTLGGCVPLFPQINNRPLRRRLRTGSADVDADIAIYRNAVQIMQGLSSADQRNWLAEADIHGKPVTGFNMCEHGTDHFFDWHRAYLFEFEKICQKLTGKPNFGLPYWNWNQNPAIHDDYLDSDSVLWGPRDHSTMNTQTGLHPAVSNTTMDTIFSDTNFFSFQAQLEGAPHNTVHNYIGGNVGVFKTPRSARDPLFWNHHCMIDYCWYKWNVEMGRQNPNDPNWTDQENGQFVDANGQSGISIPAGTTTILPLLFYRYESSAIGSNPVKVEPVGHELGRLQARLKAGADIRFVVKHRTRLAERASASTRQPLLLRSPLSARSFTTILENRNAPERVFVTVEQAEVPNPGNLFVRVFINLPGADAETPDTDPHFAGSFAFFGNPAEGHGVHTRRSGAPRFMVDVTNTLQRLRESGGMTPDSPLTVELVPTPLDATSGTAVAPVPDLRLVLSGIDILTTPVIVAGPPQR
jgi:tyrosinase